MVAAKNSSFESDEYTDFNVFSTPPNKMRGATARALGLSKIVWSALKRGKKSSLVLRVGSASVPTTKWGLVIT